MLKKLRIGTLTLLTCALVSATAWAMPTPSDITVNINGKTLDLDPAPYSADGNTLVPLRQVFEAIDTDVAWDGASQVITLTRGGDMIKLQIGYDWMGLSSEEDGLCYFEMAAAPQLIGDSTYVPLRAVLEEFGAKVDYDAATNTADISMRKSITPNKTSPWNFTVGTSAGMESFEVQLPEVMRPIMPAEVYGSFGEPLYRENALTASQPNSSTVDFLIDAKLSTIIKPGMTAEQELRAIYDLLIYDYRHDREYFNNPKYTEVFDYRQAYEYTMEDAAIELMYLKGGVCDHFAALFSCMAYRLGYESGVYGGLYCNSDGSTSPHAWSVVKIDGQVYHFDPDIECSLHARGTGPLYYLFMLTDSESAQYHIW